MCICISPLFECVCANLSSGKVVKQHFNFLTVLLGKKKVSQGVAAYKKKEGEKQKGCHAHVCVRV